MYVRTNKQIICCIWRISINTLLFFGNLVTIYPRMHIVHDSIVIYTIEHGLCMFLCKLWQRNLFQTENNMLSAYRQFWSTEYNMKKWHFTLLFGVQLMFANHGLFVQFNGNLCKVPRLEVPTWKISIGKKDN